MNDLNIYIRRLLALPYVPSLLSWIFFGLLAGVVAKLLLPGQEGLGWIRTILVGICGAFLGAFVATSMGYNVSVGWNIMGFIAAVGGSIALLLIHRLVTKT
jgi:uncharacterized membrane protein YeaQ/YmgE (transglycosylase-associated protein family)